MPVIAECQYYIAQRGMDDNYLYYQDKVRSMYPDCTIERSIAPVFDVYLVIFRIIEPG